MHMIRQNELQMIIDEHRITVVLAQPISMLELQLHGISIDDTRGHWQIVDQQMNEILVADPFHNHSRLLIRPSHRLILGIAQKLTVDILRHLHFIRSVDDPIAAQYFSQILRLVDQRSVLGQTELQRIVFVGQLGVRAGHLNGLDFNLLAAFELHRSHAGHVESAR